MCLSLHCEVKQLVGVRSTRAARRAEGSHLTAEETWAPAEAQFLSLPPNQESSMAPQCPEGQGHALEPGTHTPIIPSSASPSRTSAWWSHLPLLGWAAGGGDPGDTFPWPAPRPHPTSTSRQKSWDYSHGRQVEPDLALLLPSCAVSQIGLCPHQ